MDRVFEDEFMDAQSRIISLCVEFAGNRTDKVYAYGSIEESSISFNAFFKIDGQIKTTNNIAADPDAIWDFLDLGEADLEKIRQICIHYEKPVLTELRMIYDCKSGKIDTEYKYESICSAKTGTVFILGRKDGYIPPEAAEKMVAEHPQAQVVWLKIRDTWDSSKSRKRRLIRN